MLQDLIKAKVTATEKLSEAIFKELNKIARQMKLDAMYFKGDQESVLHRAGKVVQSKRIANLNKLYCDHVHEGGFQALWQKERGWY
jgi:hypothetical protein